MVLVQRKVKRVYLWNNIIWPWVGITTPWIYHNQDLWLISLSSDWTNWITIADRNIWATSCDISDTRSYGNYYSRWATKDRNWKSASWYTMQEDWSSWTQSIAPTWFHIPTQAEWTSIITALSSITYNNSLTYYQAMQYLLLPRSWQMLDSETTIKYAENSWWWYYWTSTKWSTTASYIVRSTASYLHATWNAVWFPRWFSVRCIKNIWVQPDSTWTCLYSISLKSYQDIKNITYWTDVVAELNKYPLEYYNKLDSDWHMVKIPSAVSQLYWIVPNPSNPGVADEWIISAAQPYKDSIWYDMDENMWYLWV